MIYYGVCIGSSDKYERYAVPGLELVQALNRTIESRNNDSIFPAYNWILDEVCQQPDLEALVLLHEDLELRDPRFELKVQEALSSPDVAIVGAIGGRGVRGIRWSKARQQFGRIVDAYYGTNDYSGGDHDVDIVDGCILILSPWAVRNLRFDEHTYHGFHAYDADICMQARAKGKRVRTAEFDAFHHTKGGFGDVRNHARADAEFRRKWGMPRAPWHQMLRVYSPTLHRVAVRIGNALRKAT